MVVVYVPIDPDNKAVLEQQKKFLTDMIQKGWKHLGHTKLKDFLGTEITVAILFSDFLWKEETDKCEECREAGSQEEKDETISASKEHIKHIVDKLTIGQMRDVLNDIIKNDVSLQEALGYVIYGNYAAFN